MGLFKSKPHYDVKAEIQVVMKSGSVLVTNSSMSNVKDPKEFDDMILNLLNNEYFEIKDASSGYKTLIPIANIEKVMFKPNIIEREKKENK